jgi:hypothetical protein
MNTVTPESPLIGIDPGYNDSAYLVWDPQAKRVLEMGHLPHAQMLDWLRSQVQAWLLVVEMMQSYGMPVGKEVLQTCVWIGRYEEAWACKDRPTKQVYRTHIKSHHCNSTKAKDAHIRQALIDKYGPIGTIKIPGPLYGVEGHLWSALAVATYAAETRPR